MDYLENYNYLMDTMGVKNDENNKKLTHNVPKEAALFPFKNNDTKPLYKNGLYNIFGEFLRYLLDKKIKNEFSLDNLIDLIMDDIKIEDGASEYLNKLLNEYIFNEKDELKLLHPYLYLYTQLSPGQKSGEKDVARFLRDIFCRDNQSLIDFFKSKEYDNNIIIELILRNAPPLDDFHEEQKFSSKLNYVNHLFNRDIEFAIKHEKFFLENMDNIFAFYYFFYITQLILKLPKRQNFDETVEELFYLLDWESGVKNRKTEYGGYTHLKDLCLSTAPRVNLIYQLNLLLGTEYKLENELFDFFNSLNSENQQNFLYYLKQWIITYRTVRGFEEIHSFDDLPNDYNQLVDILYNSLDDIDKGVKDRARKHTFENVEVFAKKYFLKRRGPYGHVLNINKDMLLMLTALCVRDKKIKLNQLFIEYEKRGIFFDFSSKMEVVNFLTKRGLIDKKSDDEDAKYVKPVLRLSFK